MYIQGTYIFSFPIVVYISTPLHCKHCFSYKKPPGLQCLHLSSPVETTEAFGSQNNKQVGILFLYYI